MTWILIAIAWYLIGFIGGILIIKKADEFVSLSDFIFLATIGGLCGVIGVFVGLNYLDPTWCKTLFKRKKIILVCPFEQYSTPACIWNKSQVLEALRKCDYIIYYPRQINHDTEKEFK